MLVIKVGGSKGIDLDLFARDLATLHQRERIVLVHGANYELDQFMRRVGVEPRLVTSSTGQVSRSPGLQSGHGTSLGLSGSLGRR